MQQYESIIYMLARRILSSSEASDVVSIDTTLYCVLYECKNKNDYLAIERKLTHTKLKPLTKLKFINVFYNLLKLSSLQVPWIYNMFIKNTQTCVDNNEFYIEQKQIPLKCILCHQDITVETGARELLHCGCTWCLECLPFVIEQRVKAVMSGRRGFNSWKCFHCKKIIKKQNYPEHFICTNDVMRMRFFCSLVDVFFRDTKYKARKKYRTMIQIRLSFIQQFPIKSAFLLDFYKLSS
jgi:hypothetical protein